MNTMAHNLNIDALEAGISNEAAAAASLQSFLTLQKAQQKEIQHDDA